MNGQRLSYASGFIRRFVGEEKEFPLKPSMGNKKLDVRRKIDQSTRFYDIDCYKRYLTPDDRG